MSKLKETRDMEFKKKTCLNLLNKPAPFKQTRQKRETQELSFTEYILCCQYKILTGDTKKCSNKSVQILAGFSIPSQSTFSH